MSEQRIPVAQPHITEADALLVAEAVRSGWVSNGPFVKRFEAEFANAVGASHAIAVANGTAALHVSLAALGIGPGHEVIVPSLTFVSTANVVLYLGAKPVLVECDPETFNVTPEIIERAITPRTRAVIPVEMNGIPLDYGPLLGLCARRGIEVVADSAESLGTRYRGIRVGSQAAIHCFSFFPNKSITTGEGGMITCADGDLAGRMRMLVNQGQDGRYNHVELGFNYRMTEMQAALGVSQLSRLDEQLAAKEELAVFYDRQLRGVPGLRLAPRPEWADAQSWYMYSISVADRAARDMLAGHLAERGIETRFGFPPIHTQPYYQRTFGYADGDLPTSLLAWEQKLDLPSWPQMSADERQRVVDTVTTGMKRIAGR